LEFTPTNLQLALKSILPYVSTTAEIESALLTLCGAPSSGIFKLNFAPRLGSAPSNSMVTYEGGGGGGGVEPEVQVIDSTV